MHCLAAFIAFLVGYLLKGLARRILANGFLANVGSDGKYEVTIALSEGENTIEVKAIDSAGNTSVAKIKVDFHP